VAGFTGKGADYFSCCLNIANGHATPHSRRRMGLLGKHFLLCREIWLDSGWQCGWGGVHPPIHQNLFSVWP
jgi:hypothetical protein